MSNGTKVPTGDYESRAAEAIEEGDRVWIDDEWQTVEAAGAWPTGKPNPKVELTTEPHSEGHVFDPRLTLYVATGEVDSRPEGEAFTLRIELGNAAMSTAADVADALARIAAEVGETGSWEGRIEDGNGNTVGRYLLGEAV